MIFLVLFIPFILAAAVAWFAHSMQIVRRSAMVLSAVGSVGFIMVAWKPIVYGHNFSYGTWWTIDGFSGLMTMLIACVYMASVLVSIRYISHELEKSIISFYQYRLYFTLFPLFALCMFITVLTNNSLVLWLALEGTTLFSTFLVGLYRKKMSIEAAWKYMILCSTGITLGLVGILLLSYGVHDDGVSGTEMFLLSTLIDHAPNISEHIIKLSFVFLFIGFGTKVGLVPMHTWLPDAHSKAPSPISAIFSAILLNVALYTIIRFKYIADAAFSHTTWTDHLFVIFGLLSVVFATLMMLIQQNYKRMLAYSSIEHMGLILFALGLSPIGAVAAVIHMIGHALIKSALFFGAGEILIRWKTTKIPNIANMSIYAPYTSILFLVGILSIIAIPPSLLFVSEYGMFTQAMALYPKTTILLFIALAVIAYAMLSLTIKMIFHRDETKASDHMQKETWNITHTIIVIELILTVLATMWLTTMHGIDVVGGIVEKLLFIK